MGPVVRSEPLKPALEATTQRSTMYEKPKVRDYGDLTKLTAVGSEEEVGVKSNETKIA